MERNKEESKQQSAQFAQFAWAQILSSNELPKEEIEKSPLIPSTVYDNLPSLLKIACSVFENDREKDVFLTAAITVLSGCFDNVSGIYDHKEVYPNLYCFVVAPPANGKGVLTYARRLGDKIHQQLLQETKEAREKYNGDLKKYYAECKKKHNTAAAIDPPKEPPQMLLFIPANNSSANVIRLLEQNSGHGIICETEADTMVNAFKQDWGGYSDLLRKAFHHEAITYSRKTNSEYTEVNCPALSVALTGTPSQAVALIVSNEDGLFSRFLHYWYKSVVVWRDVSDKDGRNYDEHFKGLGQRVFDLHRDLKSKKIEFILSQAQWQRLNNYHKTTLALMSEEMGSTVYRSGLIAFRIAMILTVLRQEGNICRECKMLCDDVDLNIAMELANIYLAHDVLAYKSLLVPKDKSISDIKMTFYAALPEKEFERKDALKIGEELNIKERTVGKYLHQFSDNGMLENVRFGVYRKK